MERNVLMDIGGQPDDAVSEENPHNHFSIPSDSRLFVVHDNTERHTGGPFDPLICMNCSKPVNICVVGDWPEEVIFNWIQKGLCRECQS
jgi:hypothetical protein